MEICPPTTVLLEVYLDPATCCRTRVCIDMCSMGVFVVDNDRVYPLNSQVCIGCFRCNDFCPSHAIHTRWIVRA